LKLSNYYDGVTANGRETLSTILRNPISALRILDLSNFFINDQVKIHFAHALVNNTMLQVLDLSRELEEEEEEDVNDFAAFSQMLCNKSNILGKPHTQKAL
jgi:hypothetical protein